MWMPLQTIKPWVKHKDHQSERSKWGTARNSKNGASLALIARGPSKCEQHKCVFMHLCMYACMHACTNVCRTMRSSLHLSFSRQSVSQSVGWSVGRSVCLLSVCLFASAYPIYPSTHPSIHHPSSNPSIHPIHPSIHPSMHLPIYLIFAFTYLCSDISIHVYPWHQCITGSLSLISNTITTK